MQSLRNWVDGNGCLAANETSYLEHDRDLVSLVPTIDNAVKRFESWIEERLVQFLPRFREVCHFRITQGIYTNRCRVIDMFLPTRTSIYTTVLL